MIPPCTHFVVPKVWDDEEWGVLPIFCYDELIQLGQLIELHFFEPRYVRLLEVVCETQIYCFICTYCTYLKRDTPAFICSINTIRHTDICGVFTKIVKINLAWVDRKYRLWWCRFQVMKVNPIEPLLEINFSPNFKCEYKNGLEIPDLRFLNHGLPTANNECVLHYNNTDEIRMYDALCTSAMKRAVIRAATNESDPEYKSLKYIPRGTYWYVTPERSKNCLDLRQLVEILRLLTKELTGSTTFMHLASMIVDLEVLSVMKICVGNSKAGIQYGNDYIVRCPMSQQANSPCFIASVDFGITVGHFKLIDVIITKAASKRILKQISYKVNKDRLRLLYIGHLWSNSPLKRIPTRIIEHITSFLVHQ
jgi:hypothetical protein